MNRPLVNTSTDLALPAASTRALEHDAVARRERALRLSQSPALLFVTREGYHMPGARVRCYGFATELNRRKIRSEVLSYKDTLGALDADQEHLMGTPLRIRYNLRALREILRLKPRILVLQRFNYHALGPYLSLWLLPGTKLVLDLDDWEMRENPQYLMGWYPTSKAHWLTGRLARRSVATIAASRFLQSELSQWSPNTYYVPTGVNTRVFKARPRPSTDRFVFGWVGTFNHRSYVLNIAMAVRCFSRLRRRFPHIELRIIGDGLYRKEVERTLERIGWERVCWEGWQNPDTIPERLHHMDVGLLPLVDNTKFNRSKSPTKLFEYMACAKPAIASNIGEASEILVDGINGMLASNESDFEYKMRQLIEQPLLTRTLGEEARNTVCRSYSMDVLGERLYDIFSPLL
ncbi:MAG: glycosyltransferase family 4 protein [Candidatus Omnitrophica bacterium]|nr:glycosyltransferase family 4 protein [Candidatus Omnitrophota bacterium]